MAETAKIVDMSGEKAERQIPDLRNEIPTRDTLLYFVGQIVELEEQLAAVQKPIKDKLKAIKRAAKDHGLFMEELNIIKKLQTKELDETPEEKGVRLVQYLVDAGIIRKQPQLEFSFNSKTTADERLEIVGYEYGLMGKTLPHEEGSDAWQKAMVGWNRGQDIRKKEFLERNAQPEEADADSSGD
jgi:hypothetical protein